MGPHKGRTVARAIAVIVLVYVVLVGSALILRMTTPLFVSTPWYELFYGPALTLASAVVLFWLCYRIAGLMGY